MTAPLCFVDTETTGLDPDRHEIWEVACLIRRPRPVDEIVGDTMYVWQLPVDLGRADPMALSMNGFHERRWEPGSRNYLPAPFGPDVEKAGTFVLHPDQIGEWCRRFAQLTWGLHMVGMVPSFDTERLGRLLRANGACPGWHYQPIDVESVAAGWLQGKAEMDGGQWKSWHQPAELDPPWDSDQLSRWCGIEPAKYDRHSALGDACWARDLWDAIQPTPWDPHVLPPVLVVDEVADMSAFEAAVRLWILEHPERSVRIAAGAGKDEIVRALEGEWGTSGTLLQMLAPLTATARLEVLDVVLAGIDREEEN